MTRCTTCGVECAGDTEGKCGRDLTAEINAVLGLHLPPMFVVCPGFRERVES